MEAVEKGGDFEEVTDTFSEAPEFFSCDDQAEERGENNSRLTYSDKEGIRTVDSIEEREVQLLETGGDVLGNERLSSNNDNFMTLLPAGDPSNNGNERVSQDVKVADEVESSTKPESYTPCDNGETQTGLHRRCSSESSEQVPTLAEIQIAIRSEFRQQECSVADSWTTNSVTTESEFADSYSMKSNLETMPEWRKFRKNGDAQGQLSDHTKNGSGKELSPSILDWLTKNKSNRESLMSQLATMRSRVCDITSPIQVKEEKLEGALDLTQKTEKTKLVEAKEKIKRLEKRVKDSDAKRYALRKLMTEQETTYNESKDQLEGQIQTLRSDIEEKSRVIDTLGKVIEVKDAEMEALQEKHKENLHRLQEDFEASVRLHEQTESELCEKLSKMEGEKATWENSLAVAIKPLEHENADLRRRFIAESNERRALYNQLLELKGNIRVFCRCRPLSPEELAEGASTSAEFDGGMEGETEVNIRAGNGTKKVFKFDRAFTPEEDQAAVFADTSAIVTSVLDGYNVCIFAYGQTGSGKTFTMEGPPDNRGVNYRTLKELFNIAKHREGHMTYSISVSVLEIYNEQIRDLLVPPSQPGQASKRLEIKQAVEGGHHVPGLLEEEVSSVDEVWDILHRGSRNRATGSTSMNNLSSRSHCMVYVMVRGENAITGECTRSKLWLVDLAGSERLAKSEAQGERLKEAQAINKSLSSLGDVFSALATKAAHVPYRNSKLTHLLQDSLGGDSKVLMFVQVSPNPSDVSETLSSLAFATRVRGVELGPARKQTDLGEPQRLKQLVERLKAETKQHEEAMKMAEEASKLVEAKLRFQKEASDAKAEQAQQSIKLLEAQLSLERERRASAEGTIAKLQEVTARKGGGGALAITSSSTRVDNVATTVLFSQWEFDPENAEGADRASDDQDEQRNLESNDCTQVEGRRRLEMDLLCSLDNVSDKVHGGTSHSIDSGRAGTEVQDSSLLGSEVKQSLHKDIFSEAFAAGAASVMPGSISRSRQRASRFGGSQVKHSRRANGQSLGGAAFRMLMQAPNSVIKPTTSNPLRGSVGSLISAIDDQLATQRSKDELWAYGNGRNTPARGATSDISVKVSGGSGVLTAEVDGPDPSTSNPSLLALAKWKPGGPDMASKSLTVTDRPPLTGLNYLDKFEEYKKRRAESQQESIMAASTDSISGQGGAGGPKRFASERRKTIHAARFVQKAGGTGGAMRVKTKGGKPPIPSRMAAGVKERGWQ